MNYKLVSIDSKDDLVIHEDNVVTDEQAMPTVQNVLTLNLAMFGVNFEDFFHRKATTFL